MLVLTKLIALAITTHSALAFLYSIDENVSDKFDKKHCDDKSDWYFVNLANSDIESNGNVQGILASEDSCVTTFPISFEIGSTLEIHVYMQVTSANSGITVVLTEELRNTPVARYSYNGSNSELLPEWYSIIIPIEIGAVARITLLGNSLEDELIIVDYFKYTPPSDIETSHLTEILTNNPKNTAYLQQKADDRENESLVQYFASFSQSIDTRTILKDEDESSSISTDITDGTTPRTSTDDANGETTTDSSESTYETSPTSDNGENTADSSLVTSLPTSATGVDGETTELDVTTSWVTSTTNIDEETAATSGTTSWPTSTTDVDGTTTDSNENSAEITPTTDDSEETTQTTESTTEPSPTESTSTSITPAPDIESNDPTFWTWLNITIIAGAGLILIILLSVSCYQLGKMRQKPVILDSANVDFPRTVIIPRVKDVSRLPIRYD